MKKFADNNVNHKYDKLVYMKRPYDSALLVYDFKTNKIKQIKWNKNQGENCRVTQINNFAYLTGGVIYNKRAFTTCYIVDLNYSKFLKISDMKFPKFNHGVVSIKNSYIYTLGGQTPKRFLKVVERYDIKKDKWLQIPSLNEEKGGVCGMQINERFIYSFFGIGDNIRMFAIEKFECS